MDNEQAPVVGRVRDFLSKFDADEDNNQVKKGVLSNPSTPNAKRKLLAGHLDKTTSEPAVDNTHANLDKKVRLFLLELFLHPLRGVFLLPSWRQGGDLFVFIQIQWLRILVGISNRVKSLIFL